MSSAPRSSSSGGRGGSASSTPRSAPSSSLRVSAAGTAVPGYIPPTWLAAGRRQPLRSSDSGRPGLTPLRVALDAASAPFYAVGNTLAGDPRNAAINLVTAGQRGRKTFVSDVPWVARSINSIPGPNWLRTGVAFTVDFATDPLTYLSFGAGGALRSGAGQAAKQARSQAVRRMERATERAVAEGRRRPSAREVAEIAVEAAEASRKAPNTLKVYFRTPLSRNRGRLIAESRLAARAAEAAIDPIRGSTFGTAMRRVFRADQGVDPALYEGRRAVRYWAEATQRDIRKAIDRERKFARKAGVDSERITMHLDQPAKFPPRSTEEAYVFERAARLRDEIEEIAREAGVEMGFVENYVMHLPKTPKDAKAFERMFRAKPENAAYTKTRMLPTLEDWVKVGITPELDVWKLMDVRAGQGIRDAAIKGYMDMAAGRGVKPMPLRMPDVGGQAIKVADMEADLARAMTRVDTAPQRKANKQARQAIKAAERAVRVAQDAGDPAAVARAERALALAEEAARPAAIMGAAARGGDGTVGDAVAGAMADVRQLSRSRAAQGASLPTPRAGRYVRTTDDKKAASRLRRRALQLRRQAKETRAEVDALLRERVRAFVAKLDADAKGAGRNVGKVARPGRAGQEVSRDLRRKEEYVYNVRDDARHIDDPQAAKGRRRKRIDEFTADYLDDLRRAADEGAPLDDVERMILEVSERADDMARQADEIDDALRAARGGEFGELDEVAGARKVRELADALPPSTVDMRRQRARGAARHGEQETPKVARNAGPEGPTKGTRRAARARFRRYFNTEGPLTEAIEAIKLGAEQEVKAATRAAQREVAKARRRLERARASNDKEAIGWANKLLRDAQRTERSVAAELARAQVTYGAKPRQIAAKVRRLVREQRMLRLMEQRARRVAEENQRLAARPGREVADYEEYRQLVAQGWETHTSKYHKGTLLDPDTHEAVRAVDAEVGRLLQRDSDVQAVARFFNQTGSAWKSLQLATPRYHLRNVLDDAFADWLAGARNPVSYAQAARILRGTQKGPIKTRAGTFTPEQIVQMAETQGVMHMGFAAWEVGKQQERGLRIGANGAIRAPGSGRIARGSRWIGEVREDWSRLGLFLEMLKKGEDVVQAGMTVRRYRYDYSDLAPFLMHARAVAIPFLTFTWKTIPMLAKQFAERPGAFSKTNIVVEYLHELGGSPDRSLLAPWEHDAHGVPAPGPVAGFFGAEEGEPVFYNPRIALRYADVEMLNPNPDAMTRNLLGMVGPIKMPVEAITGYSTFQARQLREGERVRAPLPITALADAGVPIPGYGPKKDSYTGETVPGYSARLHNILSTLPPFQHVAGVAPGPGNPDWQRRLAAFMTGLNLRPEERARATFYAERYGGR